MTVASELREMLPTWAIAVLLPIPMATFWHEGSGRAFAYCYLFLGTAILTAERFHTNVAGEGSAREWRTKMTALTLGAFGLCFVFTPFVWSMRDESALEVPLFAVLAVLPALGCVPFATLRTGNPYTAILSIVFLLASIKMLGCVVVRIAYGPTALADGEMMLPWEQPNFLVWFCLVGALICSAVMYLLGRRAFLGRMAEGETS